MGLTTLLILAVTVALIGYLVITLLFPERF